MNVSQTETKIINGININQADQLVEAITEDYTKGIAKFAVNTAWQGGSKTKTKVESCEFGGEKVARNFTIHTDEPEELFGTNTAPNPQEILMAALNACMLVTYVENAAMLGVALEKIEIETQGTLDLRGAFGLDETIKSGYEEMRCTVHIKGNGTPEQFEEIHQTVMATSPNFWNITNPVKVKPELCVES